MKLEESLKAFVNVPYVRVQRDQESYYGASEIATEELARLVALYKTEKELIRLRLLRDSMDHWIRRYHGYSIEGNFGSHYVQPDLIEDGIFEHIIPASKARDLLIAGILTSKQVLNIPTCLLSTINDVRLRKLGLVSSTPDYWLFFKRYASLGIALNTYDGKSIDQSTWTLQDHFTYFNI